MRIVNAEGSHEQIGYEIGKQLAEQIRHNISSCEQEKAAREIESVRLSDYVRRYADSSSDSSLRMMEGLSRGSRISYEAILRFNALQDVLAPEECTTFAAVGKATPDGKAVLLKNRDTSGSYRYQGPGYHDHREISIAIAAKTCDGNVIIGVTKAGSTGVMMGINKYGVAAASNFGHVAEISHRSAQELHGVSGRPQMLREGLECSSAREAANLALGKLTKSPMSTPGMLFFVESGNIYVIEGGSADNMFAVQHITDGVVFRSNHFLMLDQLNNEQEISSICRKIRANELVKRNYGGLCREKFREFSMDHKNGPDDNSICRHSRNPERSVTVSAAIMEIDAVDPQKSTLDIALGSPCWAWNNEDGHITVRMNDDIETIPQSFFDGDAFKKYLRAEAFGEE